MTTVRLTKRKLEMIKKADSKLKELAKSTVKVGIWRGEARGYAVFNEYGTATIPARPFFRTATSFDESAKEISNYTQKALNSLIMGEKSSVDRTLRRLGLYLKGRVVKSLNNGGWQDNASSTKIAKIRKWGTPKKPLVDSGDLIKAIEFEVVKNG